MRAISSDKDVVLVRVRNAMVPQHDADQTAGYRDVKLNLCIRNKYACLLALLPLSMHPGVTAVEWRVTLDAGYPKSCPMQADSLPGRRRTRV